jgi:hypothetical protein
MTQCFSLLYVIDTNNNPPYTSPMEKQYPLPPPDILLELRFELAHLHWRDYERAYARIKTTRGIAAAEASPRITNLGDIADCLIEIAKRNEGLEDLRRGPSLGLDLPVETIQRFEVERSQLIQQYIALRQTRDNLRPGRPPNPIPQKFRRKSRALQKPSRTTAPQQSAHESIRDWVDEVMKGKPTC